MWEWLIDEDYFRQKFRSSYMRSMQWEWLIDEDYFRL